MNHEIFSSNCHLPHLSATNADHGFGCNVHPPPKQFCGKRLAKSALALQYGQCETWKSPSYGKVTTSVVANSPIHVSHVAVIDLVDVTAEGLYSLDNPYNSLNGTFDCEKQLVGTCAWASVKMAQAGWVNATLSIQVPNQVVFTAISDSEGNLLSKDDTIKETAYGWGSVPMMTLYDAGSALPVLPWKEEVGADSHDKKTRDYLRPNAPTQGRANQ